MEGARSVVLQGPPVALGAIALVGCQSIDRPTPVKPLHEGIPGLLGDDAG